MENTLKLHTESGTLRFTASSARDYIADYLNSEDRERREIARDLEDWLAEIA